MRTKQIKNSSTNYEKPDVIVDFEYTKGLLFLIIENIGKASAYNISIKFNKTIRGIQKQNKFNLMKIFQSLQFLPPQKKITVFVDTFSSYLIHKQPLALKITITFLDENKINFKRRIEHDLSIYRDFIDFPDKYTI